MLDQIENWVKAGIRVYCYEAGACGYWYHRELLSRGAINFVVARQPLEGRKSQKTDRLDARALLVHLASYYLYGNHHAMSVVAVPTPEQAQQGPGLKTALLTPPNWPWKVPRPYLLSAFQSRAVLFFEAVSTRRPSGLKTALSIESVWPWKVRNCMPLSAS